jgi:hypothetical protein
MIDPHDFWGTNYYQHPPLTAESVAEAERVLRVRLPIELVELLHIQNGGYTKGFVHPMSEPTTWSEDHVPLHDLAGIVLDPTNSSPMNLVRTEELTQEWGLPPRQVLLSGDGHYWITLDYRHGESPAVSWIDVECGEDKLIAPSFKAFLQGLLREAEQSGT